MGLKCLLQFTLANIAHGYAEARLVTQIRQITFLARPTPVLEFRVSGWQMAWYLPHTVQVVQIVQIVQIIYSLLSYDLLE